VPKLDWACQTDVAINQAEGHTATSIWGQPSDQEWMFSAAGVDS
jgi:hypothetical protein